MISDWIFDRKISEQEENDFNWYRDNYKSFLNYIDEWANDGWCFANIKEAFNSGNEMLAKYSLLTYFYLVAPEWKSEELFEFIWNVDWIVK